MQKNSAVLPEREESSPEQGIRLGKTLVSDLTDREREVLEELVTGDSNRVIAGRMNLSVDTIKYHLKNLLNKTGCKTRTELAVKACRCGILPLGEDSYTL